MSRFSEPITFRRLSTFPVEWRDADDWRSRKVSKFTASYDDTMSLLRSELGHLGTVEAFLSVALRGDQVRKDGQLYASAKVDHPGVQITIRTRELGTLVYGTDEYRKGWRGASDQDWHHNLRAIATGLGALRAVERHGIASRGQQYAGFRELGSGFAMPAAMTIETARKVLGFDVLAQIDRLMVVERFRELSTIRHPDKGGDVDSFKELVDGRDVLLRSLE